MSIAQILRIIVAFLGIIELSIAILVIALATSVSKKNREENDIAYFEYVKKRNKDNNKCKDEEHETNE